MKLTARIILISSILFTCFNSLYSKEISYTEAHKVAENFLKWRFAETSNTTLQNVKLFELISDKEAPSFYIFNSQPEGFIIVSAEDNVIPILAYSTENTFKESDIPYAMRDWLEWCKIQITNSRENNLSSTHEIRTSWEALLTGDISYLLSIKNEKSVLPLITSKWDQGTHYNELCPTDLFGPGGHVWAGCVATSMSQIMHYFKHPVQGNSNSSYTHNTYGYQFANYGNTNYEWAAMTNTINSSNIPIATLMYHCGVSVEMNYSTSGSGATLSKAAYAFRNYFRYSNTVKHYEKYDYQYSWEELITTNIDQGKPILYAGFNPDDGSGHAFIIDGYDATNYFHFNWGWSGTYNGYFYLNNLNPGSNDFTSWQQAVVNIFPAGTYPQQCASTKTYSYNSGLFDDGSGPTNNYSENTDCYWLINPDNADKITLKFISFETEQDNDKVIIYDGSDNNAPILATFSGNTLPSTVSSTNGSMLIRFTTNNSDNFKGWLAEYTSEKKVSCSGTVILTEPFGLFSDGSEDADYDNNLNCKWHIKPPNAESITIRFTEFEVESTYDYVRIVDPTQSPVLTLATYSGFSIPSEFTYQGNELLVLFKTGPTNNYKGWEAEYFSTSNSINDNTVNKSNFSVYPNPASDYAYLIYNSKTDDELTISISDTKGKTNITKIYSIIQGINKLLLPISNLSSGIYFLNINNNNISTSKKLIIN